MKINFKRLYRLCDYMESLPKQAEEHFDMWAFYQHIGDGDGYPIPEKPTVKDLMTCGTTACALGWAATVPEFKRAGLLVAFGGAVVGDEKVFGIDGSTSERWDLLFGADNDDKTPKAWAKRVRKILKQWEKKA